MPNYPGETLEGNFSRKINADIFIDGCNVGGFPDGAILDRCSMQMGRIMRTSFRIRQRREIIAEQKSFGSGTNKMLYSCNQKQRPAPVRPDFSSSRNMPASHQLLDIIALLII